MPELVFKPGVVSENTPLQVGSGWISSNLIRFRAGQPSPIGGWVQVGGGTVSGVCRSLHEWSNNSGTILLALGTNLKVYVLCASTFYDITPADYVPGPADAVLATGWGVGPYSAGTYGTPRVPSAGALNDIVIEPTIWHMDNFGEDLILNPRGSHIYIWHSVGGFGQRATLLSDNVLANSVPELASGIFVNSQAQVVVALGCCPLGSRSPDPMQIRWTDIRNPYDWFPTIANSAGDYRLPSGSVIIGWLSGYFETLIWTDKGIYSMQFTGDNNVFSFQPVGRGMSMISPQAAVSNGSLFAWMDRGSFYKYSGSVSELDCPLKKEVFDNINLLQAWKSFAAHNHAFSEISWHYPVGEEVDSYVTWNYRENVWSNGKLDRTAWSDSGRIATPVAVDPPGNVYFHEVGQDANGAPLPYELISGDIEISDGDSFVTLQRIIHDFKFQQNLGENQRLFIDYMVRDSSNEPRRVVNTAVVSPNNINRGYFDTKIRGRRVSIRIYNDAFTTGTSWVLGKLQAKYRPSGKR